MKISVGVIGELNLNKLSEFDKCDILGRSLHCMHHSQHGITRSNTVRAHFDENCCQPFSAPKHKISQMG